MAEVTAAEVKEDTERFHLQRAEDLHRNTALKDSEQEAVVQDLNHSMAAGDSADLSVTYFSVFNKFISLHLGTGARGNTATLSL